MSTLRILFDAIGADAELAELVLRIGGFKPTTTLEQDQQRVAAKRGSDMLARFTLWCLHAKDARSLRWAPVGGR
jgi:hypothetical protein